MNVYYKILFGRPPAPTSYLASVGALPNDKNRNGSGGGAPENAVIRAAGGSRSPENVAPSGSSVWTATFALESGANRQGGLFTCSASLQRPAAAPCTRCAVVGREAGRRRPMAGARMEDDGAAAGARDG